MKCACAVSPKVQFKNTIRDLTAFALGDASAVSSVVSQIKTAMANVPAEGRALSPRSPIHGTFRRASQDVLQEHADAYYGVGLALGAALTSSANLPRLLGACASQANGLTTVFGRPPSKMNVMRSVSNVPGADRIGERLERSSGMWSSSVGKGTTYGDTPRMYAGLVHNRWLGTILQSMGLAPSDYERDGVGGYGKLNLDGTKGLFTPQALTDLSAPMPMIRA